MAFGVQFCFYRATITSRSDNLMSSWWKKKFTPPSARLNVNPCERMESTGSPTPNTRKICLTKVMNLTWEVSARRDVFAHWYCSSPPLSEQPGLKPRHVSELMWWKTDRNIENRQKYSRLTPLRQTALNLTIAAMMINQPRSPQLPGCSCRVVSGTKMLDARRDQQNHPWAKHCSLRIPPVMDRQMDPAQRCGAY